MAAPANGQTDTRSGSSRERILHAAKQLFASRGYENTSTVGIARLAGTSESQLMKHFGSKEGLLEAIFDAGWESLESQVAAVEVESSPRQKLRTLLQGSLAALERDPELKQLMLLEGRRIRKEGRMVMITNGFLTFIKLLDEILSEMQAAGQLSAKLNPTAVRSALMGMFEGLTRDQLLAQQAGFPCNFGTTEMQSVFDAFLSALQG